MSHYLAVDIGTESGRVMLGTVSASGIALTELHRFDNAPVAVGRALHWDILKLWQEMLTGIARGAALGQPIDGLAITAWGVDFALLAEDGGLLSHPICFRDPRTRGMPEKVFDRLPREKLYAATGVQTRAGNTLFQLAALREQGSSALLHAAYLLFIPDLLSFWLTGTLANEYTVASTSQMMDARNRAWSTETLRYMGVSIHLFPQLLLPGRKDSRWGKILQTVGEPIGAAGMPVLACASHGVASAVAAVPARGDDWLYLIPDTRCVLGVEVPEPVLTEQAMAYGLTNEGGLDGTILLQKNVAGVGLVHECIRAWEKAGVRLDEAQWMAMAEPAQGGAVIDLNDEAWVEADANMPGKIAAACRRAGQREPASPAECVRVILESLAASYAQAAAQLAQVTGRTFRNLHVVGEGSQNDLLNQLVADATGLRVHAGPVEAVPLGNVLAQAMTTGQIASLAEGRALVAKGVRVRVFGPR